MKAVKDAAQGGAKRQLTEDELHYGYEVGKLALQFPTKEKQQAYLVERELAYQNIVASCLRAGFTPPSRLVLSGEE